MLSDCEHGVAEVAGDHLCAPAPRQGHAQVCGAATKVQHAGGGIGKQVAEMPGSDAAPIAVHLKREKMVQQVVAGRDVGEQPADVPGS